MKQLIVQKDQYRSTNIDILRALGIVLVFVGHAWGAPNSLKNTIYLFHMPLFFCISGFLYKERSIRQVIRDKAKTLVYPYFSLGILVIIYNTVNEYYEQNIFSIKLFCRRFVVLLIGSNIYADTSANIGVLWFVICLFVTCILFEICKRKLSLIVVPLVTVGGVIYSQHRIVWLPYEVDVASIALSFFTFGYLIKKNLTWSLDNDKKKKMVLASLAMIIIGFGIGIANLNYLGNHTFFDRDNVLNRPDMLWMSFGDSLLFFTGACLISGGLILFAANIEELRHPSCLGFIGKNSLLMMVFSIYVQVNVAKYAIRWQMNLPILSNWVVQVIISITISMALTYVVSKYLPILYKMRNRDSDKG